MLELKLFEASPAWTIEDDALVGFDLAFTQGLRLRGIDTVCSTDETLEELSRGLSEMLCSIPDDCIVQFHSIELVGNDALLREFQHQFSGDPIGSYVARKKAEQCAVAVSPRRREQLCFVTTPPAATFSGYNPRLLGRKTSKLLESAQQLHEQKTSQVTRLRRLVARGLKTLGVGSEVLGGQELFGALWTMANPVGSQRLASPSYRPDASLRYQLFNAGLYNQMDRFVREGALNRVLTLKLPPQAVVPTQIRELQYLPFRHHLSVTLRRVSEREALSRVERSRRQGHELDNVLARFRGARRHAEMPDHVLVRQQADVNDVLDRLNNGERLFEMAMHLWFSAPDEDELVRRTEIAMSAFRGCGQAEAAIEELRGRFAFLGMLPGHQALIGDRFHPILATRAADLLPVFNAHPGSTRPTGLLSTGNGELVGFHPFDRTLPAWNATIAGGTGSGKSFITRTLLTGWIASGGRALVVTRGGDYHRYAEIFGGTVYDVSLDDPDLALGPFPSVASVREHDNPEIVFEHLTGMLALMLTEPGKPLERLTRHLVYKATKQLYADPSTTASPTFRDWFEALERLRDKEPDSQAIAIYGDLIKHMRFWLDGPYGPAFCRNRPDGPEPLSVWNLESIHDEDTQSVVLGVLSGLIRQSVAAGPTIIVLDEVWSILKSEAGASLAEVLYRTVRKEGSGIWTISQSMNDYTLLPESARSAILNNSPIKLFLQHDPSDLELVTTTFQLTTRERELLAELRSVPGRFSELLAFFGKRRQLLRLVPCPIEYWLATSHPKDIECEEYVKTASPGVSPFALLKRLARRFPNGAIHHSSSHAA